MFKIKFKNLILGIVIGVVLTLPIGGFAEEFFQFRKSAYTLYVDGEQLDITLYNYQYTNYASIRAVAEALGLGVDVVNTDIYFTSQPVVPTLEGTTELMTAPTSTPTPMPEGDTKPPVVIINGQ